MIVQPDAPGIKLIKETIQSGKPVILPPPSPITYGVAGTDPALVNMVKGRPENQPTAIGLTSIEPVSSYWDVDTDAVPLIDWLIFHEHLTVLVPVRTVVPAWFAPATAKGHALMAGAWLPETLEVIESVEVLYLSSGNRTSAQPKSTARAADEEFDGQLLVLDGDALRAPAPEYGATTMLRVDRSGNLTLNRNGIQNAGFPQDDQTAFLADLNDRFLAQP